MPELIDENVEAQDRSRNLHPGTYFFGVTLIICAFVGAEDVVSRKKPTGSVHFGPQFDRQKEITRCYRGY
jgi:hypothetical protein